MGCIILLYKMFWQILLSKTRKILFPFETRHGTSQTVRAHVRAYTIRSYDNVPVKYSKSPSDNCSARFVKSGSVSMTCVRSRRWEISVSMELHSNWQNIPNYRVTFLSTSTRVVANILQFVILFTKSVFFQLNLESLRFAILWKERFFLIYRTG